MWEKRERAREKTPWKITQTTAKSQGHGAFSYKKWPCQILTFLPQKSWFYISRETLVKKMFLLINCLECNVQGNDPPDQLVCCLLFVKWINRAVSETDSQGGNHNRCLQACVASVASNFHTILICFLRLSHNSEMEFVQNRCVIFLIKAWKLAQSHLTYLQICYTFKALSMLQVAKLDLIYFIVILLFSYFFLYFYHRCNTQTS